MAQHLSPEQVQLVHRSITLAVETLLNASPLKAWYPGARLMVSTDGSTHGIGGALYVIPPSWVLNPTDPFKEAEAVAYFSRGTTAAEAKYSAYGLELLAGAACFAHWFKFLKGSHVTWLTDHKPLCTTFHKPEPPP